MNTNRNIGRFYTNMRNNFLTLRMTEHWNRLPREAVESLLETFKTCLDASLYNLVGNLL